MNVRALYARLAGVFIHPLPSLLPARQQAVLGSLHTSVAIVQVDEFSFSCRSACILSLILWKQLRNYQIEDAYDRVVYAVGNGCAVEVVRGRGSVFASSLPGSGRRPPTCVSAVTFILCSLHCMQLQAIHQDTGFLQHSILVKPTKRLPMICNCKLHDIVAVAPIINIKNK